MLKLILGGLFGVILGFFWLVMLYQNCSMRVMWATLISIAAVLYGSSWLVMRFL